MDGESQPFTPHSGVPEGSRLSQQNAQLCDPCEPRIPEAEEPADMAEDQQAEAVPDWMSGILQDLLSTEVKSALDSVLLPRTRTIEQEVKTMQNEAQSIGIKSNEEHAEVEDDLARMAKLVYDFQNHISQFLPNGLPVAHSIGQADENSPE